MAGPENRQDCGGTLPAVYTIVKRDGAEAVEAQIIHEQLVTFFVNGQELATMMCTPCDVDALALGFLANEGVIRTRDDVRALHVCPSGSCVDVWLREASFEPPRRMVLTSGCGGGVTFDDLSKVHEPIDGDICVTPEQLWELMDELYRRAHLYSRARGVHTSVFSDGERVLVSAEDVGRHNTLDKLRGRALLEGIDTTNGIILTTGRISSEMINKVRSMGVPLVCSRTSPTSLSVRLAAEWRMTLVGYLRRNSMNIYTSPERVICSERRVSSTPDITQVMESSPHV